jgi:type IV secretory pathway TrbL component
LGYHLLELLLLVVPGAVLLLVVALVVVVPLSVVILIGGVVELLPLGAIGDEVGGVAALKAALGRSSPLLAELVQGTELSRQQGDLVVWMLSCCSSEAADKEDKTNSKADESVVLVRLVTWPST